MRIYRKNVNIESNAKSFFKGKDCDRIRDFKEYTFQGIRQVLLKKMTKNVRFFLLFPEKPYICRLKMDQDEINY